MRCHPTFSALASLVAGCAAASAAPAPPPGPRRTVDAATDAGGLPAPGAAPEPKVAPLVLEPDRPFDDALLVLYFTASPLRDAVRDLVEDKGAAALKKIPPSPTEPPARYLKALALFSARSYAESAKLLEDLAQGYPVLSVRCRTLAARARAEAGDWAESARILATLVDHPVIGRSTRLEWARALAAAGDRRRATEALDPLIRGDSGWIRAEALFFAARMREDAGDNAAALEGYRRVFVEEPVSARANEARARARRLVAKLKAPPIGDDRLAERAERLLSAGLPRAAAVEAAALKDPALCGRERCTWTACRLAAVPSVSPAATGTAPAADAVETKAPADSEGAAVEASENQLEKEEKTEADVAAEGESSTAAEAARPAASFALSGARDPEDRADEPRPLPACVVAAPASPADPVACRVALVKGIVARRQRNYPKALEFLRPAYERCADPSLRAKALFHAAGAAAALRDPDAPDLALLLALQFRTDPLADDALVASAAALRDAGDRPRERAALREVARWHAEGDSHAEALFRLFWSHRAEGHPERGLPWLETLWKQHDRPRGEGADAERGRYWWGRTVAESARPEDRPAGARMLVQLARERSLTYYGLLASSLLAGGLPAELVAKARAAEPAAAPPATGPATMRPGLLASDPAFAAAIELFRLGFPSDARDALRAVQLAPLRREGARGRESILLLAELIARSGDERGAHGLLRAELLGWIRAVDDPLSRRACELAYPLAYRRIIVDEAAAAGLPADFLQGLMREESAMDPRARSPVGARGLVQLMPATARQVAKSLGIKRFAIDRLWEPATNLRLGSTYLGRMQQQFGHPGLAAAAYNAGPGAVSRWMADRGGAALDEFVEDIPFAETRGYVKRVLKSWAAYRALYGARDEASVKVSLTLAATR